MPRSGNISAPFNVVSPQNPYDAYRDRHLGQSPATPTVQDQLRSYTEADGYDTGGGVGGEGIYMRF